VSAQAKKSGGRGSTRLGKEAVSISTSEGSCRSTRISRGISVSRYSEMDDKASYRYAHPSGRVYQWSILFSPRILRLPSQFTLVSPGEDITSGQGRLQAQVATPDAEGSRNETLTRLAVTCSPRAVPPDEVYEWLRCYSQVHCRTP